MSIEHFKKQLEEILFITNWSPTESELLEISRRINQLNQNVSKTDIAKIVYDIVGSYESMTMEGVDNSDLTTLLKLATKTTGK
ncbi:hypothetical protein [Phocoenobacter skyensis]|uniref:Uncharacterized protein n=1 Tax=Phocoenobacter skyensis TaxID=97481 RepID=A0A1H7WPX2_9PAST|nr:hypothetical protein [Pasteurella skyensis]MDP8078976.1 hypothetical protein [Pasteurella skyensis]MDP8084926.1 hypothetical protein [Pasteurella skyensis]MDP8185228.1 hypothetical protein [Pasteurella skyensis]QLB23493.1 hypothetical protein A6B44_09895 [Pasteurella skyensis]SEM22997.1 hypothetical protein SAMN05444853_10929 [Pasteurella skyensis]